LLFNEREAPYCREADFVVVVDDLVCVVPLGVLCVIVLLCCVAAFCCDEVFVWPLGVVMVFELVRVEPDCVVVVVLVGVVWAKAAALMQSATSSMLADFFMMESRSEGEILLKHASAATKAT
jgi:hypothetical protein